MTAVSPLCSPVGGVRMTWEAARKDGHSKEERAPSHEAPRIVM